MKKIYYINPGDWQNFRDGGPFWEDKSNQDFWLSGIDFQGLNRVGVAFCHSRLCGINFMEANLTMAIFFKADLTNTIFFKANLRRANFRGAYLEGTNFVGANLKGADFWAANFGPNGPDPLKFVGCVGLNSAIFNDGVKEKLMAGIEALKAEGVTE